jgi:hypothetical protein
LGILLSCNKAEQDSGFTTECWENENFLMVKMLSNNQMTSITTSDVQLIYDHLNDDDLALVVFDGTFNNATTSQFYRIAATNKLFTTAEGFTLQELLEAEAILNPLRTKEEIERMCFYSGGSARVDVLKITVSKEHSKNLESVGAFLQCLFPRDHQPDEQFPHQMVVRYLTVTSYANSRRFDMSGGALSGS